MLVLRDDPARFEKQANPVSVKMSRKQGGGGDHTSALLPPPPRATSARLVGRGRGGNSPTWCTGTYRWSGAAVGWEVSAKGEAGRVTVTRPRGEEKRRQPPRSRTRVAGTLVCMRPRVARWE